MATALLNIPVSPVVPSQVITVTLDGKPFVFRFWWNQRSMRWFYDLSTPGGVSIQRCKGLCVGADPLRQVRARPEAPQGVLTVVDTVAGAMREPTLTSIGGRHRVVYFQDTSSDVSLDLPTIPLVIGPM